MRLRSIHAVLIAAAVTACSKDKPREANRVDLIDVAAWQAACGQEHSSYDVERPDVTVPYHRETFLRPSLAQPKPESPVFYCAVESRLHGGGLLRAKVRIDSTAEEELKNDPTRPVFR